MVSVANQMPDVPEDIARSARAAFISPLIDSPKEEISSNSSQVVEGFASRIIDAMFGNRFASLASTGAVLFFTVAVFTVISLVNTHKQLELSQAENQELTSQFLEDNLGGNNSTAALNVSTKLESDGEYLLIELMAKQAAAVEESTQTETVSEAMSAGEEALLEELLAEEAAAQAELDMLLAEQADSQPEKDFDTTKVTAYEYGKFSLIEPNVKVLATGKFDLRSEELMEKFSTSDGEVTREHRKALFDSLDLMLYLNDPPDMAQIDERVMKAIQVGSENHEIAVWTLMNLTVDYRDPILKAGIRKKELTLLYVDLLFSEVN
jgi:hypothetical protein